jgi:hypothetical protein
MMEIKGKFLRKFASRYSSIDPGDIHIISYKLSDLLLWNGFDSGVKVYNYVYATRVKILITFNLVI